MRRQPHLINKAIAYYLTASILSSVVVQLNTLVDGIVVGQCVGTDAFSAINLYTPISSTTGLPMWFAARRTSGCYRLCL